MADTELANNHIFRVVKDLTEPSNASTFSRFVTMYGVGTVEALAEFSSEGLERVGFSPHLIGELTQILDENYGGLTFALPDKARSVEIGQLEQTIESASELVGQDTAQKPLRETSYVDQVVRGYDVIDQGSYLLVNGNKVEIPTSANALSKERITEIFKLHS